MLLKPVEVAVNVSQQSQVFLPSVTGDNFRITFVNLAPPGVLYDMAESDPFTIVD